MGNFFTCMHVHSLVTLPVVTLYLVHLLDDCATTVSPAEQELLTFSEHSSSLPFFDGIVCFCVLFCRSFFLLFFLLTIVLSVLRFTVSDYPYGILILFLSKIISATLVTSATVLSLSILLTINAQYMKKWIYLKFSKFIQCHCLLRKLIPVITTMSWYWNNSCVQIQVTKFIFFFQKLFFIIVVSENCYVFLSITVFSLLSESKSSWKSYSVVECVTWIFSFV